MKISEMIAVLQDVITRTGDVEIQGTCWNCQTDNLNNITVLEDEHYASISLDLEEDE